MAINIHNLIAAINPDLYCQDVEDRFGEKVDLRAEVKNLVKEKGYLAAAKVAKPRKSEYMNFEDIIYKSPFSASGIKNPLEQHSLEYESFGENLEPIYYWIIDSLTKEYSDMKKVDKLIDNFVASAGSTFFSEIGMKATRMQEEAMKILANANVVIKSILNVLYDLKEFRMRLDLYDKLKSNNVAEKNAALLSLKQIWMDTVDIKRGNTSLKGLVQQFNYVTIIDSFMSLNNLKDVEKIDLNERVKRILAQRAGEFFSWIAESEKELQKRFEIEKIYLKSQISAVKIYARWVKPYLKAAQQLEQRATPTAALVNAFNTVLFELTLLGEAKYDVKDDINRGELPDVFAKIRMRTYSPIIIIELKFRSIPERAGQQGYGFRGKIEATFTSYALNEDELKALREEVEKDDLGDMFKVIEGVTDESLAQMRTEIDEYTNEKSKVEDKKESEDINPFSALVSFFKKKGEKEGEKELSKGIRPDSSEEKVVRSQAIIKARQECRKIYDLFKKTHQMPAF